MKSFVLIVKKDESNKPELGSFKVRTIYEKNNFWGIYAPEGNAVMREMGKRGRAYVYSGVAPIELINALRKELGAKSVKRPNDIANDAKIKRFFKDKGAKMIRRKSNGSELTFAPVVVFQGMDEVDAVLPDGVKREELETD